MEVTPQAQAPAQPAVEGVQAPAQEAPKAEEAKQDSLSPRFAALARQTKELRQKQAAIKAQEEALKAKEAEYQTKYIPRDQLSKNPLEVLGQMGITYDQLVQMALNQPSPQDQRIEQVTSEIQTLQQKIEAQNKAIEERQNKDYEMAVNQIRSEIKALVASDEKYETIKESSAEEAVVELIKETFDQTGQMLSLEDAAKQVEEYLIEEALKFASFKKVKEKLTPQPVVPATPQNKADLKKTYQTIQKNFPQQTQTKTLTNAETVSQSRGLTDRERRERAIAAFRGQLT